MRLEIKNNNSAKSSCVFSNLMQKTILTILNVVIMMRMIYASFMQVLWKCWHDKIWGISHRGGNERGATATTTEMVPRQHFDDPTTRQDVVAKESVDVQNMQKKVGWSRIPGSHMSVAWQKRGIASDSSITVQTRASHTTHAFLRGRRLGVIPSKRRRK